MRTCIQGDGDGKMQQHRMDGTVSEGRCQRDAGKDRGLGRRRQRSTPQMPLAGPGDTLDTVTEIKI